MEFPLRSRIALAHLLVINMDGTKQYLQVPWPDALCHGDPSTFLEPVWDTASATYISIVPTTPTMDSTYGTFSAHTASVLTDTSLQRQLCTSTPSFYTEITKTYVIPGSKFYCQRRIYMQTN